MQNNIISTKKQEITADFLENNFNINGLKNGIFGYGTAMRLGHPDKFQEYLDKANRMLKDINSTWQDEMAAI
jgi:hypothetical protein